MGNKKLQVWLPLIFSIVLIGGMFFGFKLRENTPSGLGFFKADKKSSLQQILDLVKQRYVDPVNTDSLQENAIDEMMSHLDPHSIDSEDAAQTPAGAQEHIAPQPVYTYDAIIDQYCSVEREVVKSRARFLLSSEYLMLTLSQQQTRIAFESR